MPSVDQILTPLGFNRPSYNDFLAENQQRARELFGEDVDLTEDTALGQWIMELSYRDAEHAELAEKVYLSGGVDTAEGLALDYAIKRGAPGMTRFKDQYSTGYLVFTVEPGTSVAVNTIIETAKGVQVMTTEAVTDTTNSGRVQAKARAVNYGVSGNIEPNTATVIKTPQAGVQSVTNPEAFTGGRLAETDKELRTRYYQSTSRSGSATSDAIRAAILELSTVRAAIVRENDTAETVDGLPPHCVAPVVLGGDQTEIATAINSKRTAGIQSFGTTTVEITDKSGQVRKIGFSYAEDVDIYVNITIKKNAAYPANGDDLVKTRVIEYIGGTDQDDTTYPGLGMGDSVVIMQIVRAIDVIGIDDLTVEIRAGLEGEFVSTNLPIEGYKVAQTDFEKVVIIDG